MTYTIRNALVVLPLGLILSGCAGPQRIESSHHRTSRASRHPAAMVVDKSGSRSNETLASGRREPSAVDSQHDITLDQICKHVKNNTAVVIDARSPEDFARGHVRGAINVPAGQMEAFVAQIQQNVTSDEFIIIYCASSSCGSGDMVCEYLAAQGYTNMRVYKPGWQQLALAENLQ